MTMKFEQGIGGTACETLHGQCQDVLVCRDITQDGKTVRIEVQYSGEDGWILRIIGRDGQVSEWTELFASSADAMTTALTAIRYEGIEDFYDDPVFQYLQERHSH